MEARKLFQSVKIASHANDSSYEAARDLRCRKCFKGIERRLSIIPNHPTITNYETVSQLPAHVSFSSFLSVANDIESNKYRKRISILIVLIVLDGIGERQRPHADFHIDRSLVRYMLPLKVQVYDRSSENGHRSDLADSAAFW